MRPIAVALLLLFCSAISFTQQAPAKPAAQLAPAPAATPAASAAQSVAPNSAKDSQQQAAAPDYSQQAFVVEHFSQSLRFENDGTGRDETNVQIKIISESGVQAFGQVKVGYSALSDKLEIAYVRVRKPDGTVITAQDSAVQDLTFADAPVYTDFHEKHISVPSLRPGDVLEYRFIRTIFAPLAPGQFWTSFNFAEKGIVLDEQLVINVPKDRQIKLKTKPGYDAKITDEGDRRIYRWTHSRLKDDDEDKKKKKAKKPGDDVPSVELTTFKSWQEVGAWYANLERERRVPDATVKTEAATLVKGKGDDLAKVKALYDYVSRNIRYVSLSFGLGRIQPHPASEVLANGYGDCKDKNTLLASLLQVEGFHATSVLIGSERKLDPEVPAPQFDHVITRVSVDGKEIWLDSTPGVAPFRMLSSNLRGKQALAIIADGNSELVWTPKDLPFAAFDRTILNGAVSDTGKVTAHVTIISRGDSEEIVRYAMRRMPSNHWKDIFDRMLDRTRLSGGEITNLKSTDPSATDEPLQVDFDISTFNYFDWSAAESKFTLPLSTVVLPSGGDDDDDDDSSSSEPIKLAVLENQAEVKLTFPPKYKLRIPVSVDVKRDYAEYRSTYKYDAGQFSSTRTVKLLMNEIPQSRGDDYAAFRRVVAADETQQLTLENSEPGATGAAGNESAADLNRAAMQALANQHYDLAIDLLNQLVKLDPKYKSAWDNLGRAYVALGKNDQAVQAFQKQIEINPYDDFAYNGLGVAYQRQSKYDESIAQFRKQIEINPLDPNAHANLGGLLVTQKKFTDAIPELEKAADLQPRNPQLQIWLGQSYIATNQTDKGMSAFEKAVTLAPVPMTWNNIAYSLSQQNIQLDRAGKYADAAISAVETQMRDVSLDRLRFQDLGNTSFLFNVWDTKGWIEFKRGNVESAESYILAAWRAGGNGEEAEHLGEIAEKQGKRDEAIQYYLFSLLTENASPEGRARLAALGIKDIDGRLAAARTERTKQQTVALHKSDKGSAQFYLLISPAKVEDVKFIKGDDNLKGLTDVLRTSDTGMKFPSDVQAQVVRRALVQCGATAPGPCSLELLPASEVRSLE